MIPETPELSGTISNSNELLRASSPDTKVPQDSLVVESYRSLRSLVLFQFSENSCGRVLLVTSSLQGEGKTTTAINLAITFAKKDRRVLLIDADLRNPSIPKAFGFSTHVEGLSTALESDTRLERVLVRCPQNRNLFILPAGLAPVDPAELLSSPHTMQLLAYLKQQFDYIIIDTPPILGVSDALILVSRVDAVLLVVRESITPKQALSRSRELLRKANATNVGVVLNGVDRSVCPIMAIDIELMDTLQADSASMQDRNATYRSNSGAKLMRSSPTMFISLRLQLLAAVALYIGLLHIAYLYLTVPYFSYVGMYYSPISEGAVVWSWLIALLPVVWLPLKFQRPSLVVYYFLYTFVIIPACIVPAYTGTLSIENLTQMQIALVVCFALLGLVYLLPLSYLPRVHLSKMWFLILVMLFSCASYVTIVHFVGFSFRFPDPSDPYAVRGDYNELMGNINSKWLGYCTNWQSFVINPFFVAYGFLSRKYYLLAIGAAGQLAIYALGGLKTVLFSLLLTVILLVMQRCRHFGLTFLWGMALFVGVCMVCDRFLLHTSLGLTSLFVRRLVFIPGQLTGMFFDFFSHNRFALLGHSVLKGLVNYPYSLEPPYLIGETYFSNDRMAADANLWGDGFANFGYFGMLGATLLLGCWLWLVDSSGIDRNGRLIMLMVGVPGIVLANCGLLTCLGNHGLGFTLALIYLLPRDFVSFEPVSNRAQRSVRRKWALTHVAD